MDTIKKSSFGLTNNQLKIIAMVSMMIDHIGLLFFTDVAIFRVLGRFAFPIFAYMIAEGCRYTKNKKKYLGIITAMALVFQVVYFVAMESLYQGILVTFSLAIITIYSIDTLRQTKKRSYRWLSAGVLLFVAVFVILFPILFAEVGFAIDYGIWGLLIPVAVYFAPNKLWRIGSVTALLVARGIYYTFFIIYPLQWFSLLSVPLLALYNGKRGKRKMKYVFYIFYPAHLVLLYGIAILLQLLK